MKYAIARFVALYCIFHNFSFTTLAFSSEDSFSLRSYPRLNHQNVIENILLNHKYTNRTKDENFKRNTWQSDVNKLKNLYIPPSLGYQVIRETARTGVERTISERSADHISLTFTRQIGQDLLYRKFLVLYDLSGMVYFDHWLSF